MTGSEDCASPTARGAAPKVLVVGLNHGLMQAIDRLPTGRADVFLLEEPTIFGEHEEEYRYASIAEVRTARYVAADAAVAAGLTWHADLGFDAVLPGREYAVRPAAEIARRAGLRSPGIRAARLCTDKLQFRDALAAAGVPVPRYAAVSSVDDVRGFVRGSPAVLKPRARHGSLGVQLVRDAAGAASAWDDVQHIDEGTHAPRDRELHDDHLIEEYIEGPEYSVESIVRDGQVTFSNITGKTLGELPYFAEVGHVVPAVVAPADRTALESSVAAMIAALRVENGILHSEWRVRGGRAYSIECAARIPGDRIPRLIELSYGLNLAQEWVRVVSGDAPYASRPNLVGCAATWFFTAAPGTVTRVTGFDGFAARHDIVEASPPVVGDIVPTLRDSHSRPGFFVVAAPDHAHLKLALDDFSRSVQVDTE